MGQRQKAALMTPGAVEYKYANHVQCEENEDAHVVTPTVWPPSRQGMQTSEPTVPLQCTLCGCWCIVSKGHADGSLPNVRVILPKAPMAPQVPPTRRLPRVTA